MGNGKKEDRVNGALHRGKTDYGLRENGLEKSQAVELTLKLFMVRQFQKSEKKQRNMKRPSNRIILIIVKR